MSDKPDQNTVILNGIVYDEEDVANCMDDEIRESVVRDLKDPTPQEFLDEYCARHLAEYRSNFEV